MVEGLFKKESVYQLGLYGDVVRITENGLVIYRKGRELVKFTSEQTDEILEQYEEINR